MTHSNVLILLQAKEFDLLVLKMPDFGYAKRRVDRKASHRGMADIGLNYEVGRRVDCQIQIFNTPDRLDVLNVKAAIRLDPFEQIRALVRERA
jgi:hypothetical protein